MDTYRIPLVWQMYGHCDIDANSLEGAIEIALGPDTPLPDGSYVDDSVAIDYEVLELVQGKKNNALTKQELRLQLQQGHTLNDLLAFGPGQDCEIFKADKFYPGNIVIYVPDDDKQAQVETAGTLCVISFVASLIVTIIGLCVYNPLFHVLNVPMASMQEACEYMKIICYGTIFVFGFNAICSIKIGRASCRERV